MPDWEGLVTQWGFGSAMAMAGLSCGLLFGFMAQRSQFCLRAAVVEFVSRAYGRKLAIWLLAFGTTITVVVIATLGAHSLIGGNGGTAGSQGLGGDGETTGTSGAVANGGNVLFVRTKRQAKDLVREAAAGYMGMVMSYDPEPKVSIDFNHTPYSSIFAPDQTKVVGKLVRVLAWYDNEWGFSCRMADVAGVMGRLLQ